MNKIKNFQNFNESFGKIYTYLSSVLKRGGKFASDVWEATKVEGEETKIAIGILSRMLKGDDVTDKEKQFLKAQSGDLVRIIPLVAISGIPIPVPITPLLIMLGKKYGFDFLPKDNRDILSNKLQLPDSIVSQLKDLPETGMGYHVVDILLKDGRVITDRKIINGSQLVLNSEESIDTENLSKILVKID